MSHSILSSTNSTASAVPTTLQNARAADGDYKTRSAFTSQVKDADGDYKAAASSPAGKSSSAVQAALSNLVKGG